MSFLYLFAIFMNGLIKIKYLVGDIKNDAEISENFLYEPYL